jgi:hypothetical protein
VLLILLTGCQAGKFRLPGMALLGKNDRLSPEYIEPPSLQFDPGDSEIAEVNIEEGTPSDDSGPPRRPDQSLEAFAADVNRSWEKLAEQTESSVAEHAESVNQAMVDLANVSVPPNAGAMSPDSASEPAPDKSFERNSNDFQPGSAASTSVASGATNYERLAQNTLAPLTPATPSGAASGLASRQDMASAPVPESNPGQFKPDASTAPSDSWPPGMAAKSTDIPGSDGGVRMQNPYIANQAKTSTGNTPTADSQASPQSKYETTPYPPFQPRADLVDTTVPDDGSGVENVSATTDGNAAPGASRIPAMLDLSGQASYAPGSVRRPDPVQPEEVEVISTAGGGAFRR